MTLITKHTSLCALSSFITLGFALLGLLSSAVTNVNAAPTQQNVALAQKYAPQFRFYSSETFFPSTIEFFLDGPVVLYDSNGPVANTPTLTESNLGSLPNQGNNTYLTVVDIKSNLNGFLGGQNPSTTQTSTYVFIAPKDGGVVDFYYWIFCPYNLGKNVPVLGLVGDHVGDWEHLTVRTVNGTATSIDYHAHDDYGSGTIPYSQAPKFSPSSPNDPPTPTPSDPNARPVAYVANGSHGMWDAPGTFTYVNAVVFQLQDVTSDGGVYWDTGSGNSIVAIDYPAPDPSGWSGSLNWVNYLGDYGNKGTTSCWWHLFYDECELVDGPPGPARADTEGVDIAADFVVPKVALATTSGNTTFPVASKLKKSMNSPLSHTLASTSQDDSSYTVRISSSNLPTGFITVDQRCATLNETSTTSDNSTPSYTYTSNLSSVPLSSSSSKVQSMVSSSSGSGSGTAYTYTYMLSVPACDSPSTVSSYSVGVCSDNVSETDSQDDIISGCNFGAQRSIRAYSDDPNTLGIQQVQAVDVNDLDTWRF